VVKVAVASIAIEGLSANGCRRIGLTLKRAAQQAQINVKT
jgi:hypothetical protein